MALKRVSGLPEVTRPDLSQSTCKESYVAADVREFARDTTYRAAEVTIEGKKPAAIVAALRLYIKRHRMQYFNIHAAVRDDKAYLYRGERN